MNIVNGDSETKISVFIDSVFVEYVRWLYVTMKEASLMNIVVSSYQLSHDLNCLEIRNSFALLNQAIQISLAKFSYEVGVVPCCIDIVQMQDVFGLS
jgi:hypothetical protein